MTTDERNALVVQYLPLVRSIVGKFKASGLPPQIEASDLESEGFLQLVKAIDSHGDNPPIDLTAQLERRVRDSIIRFIKDEMRHWPASRVAWEKLFNADGEPSV